MCVTIDAMTTLNKIGAKLAPLESVVAMTDVTGFGLLGHLKEICESSGVGATVWFDRVPLLPNVHKYREMGCIPGGAKKNFKSYGEVVSHMSQEQREILCDAQTSGGLLVVVKRDGVDEFLHTTAQEGLTLQAIGETTAIGKHLIEVI